MKSLIPWKREQRHAAPARWDEWFDRMWADPFTSLLPGREKHFASALPSIDVSEDSREVRVRAELPGLDQKDLDLSWHDGILRIRGEKKDEREEKKKGHHYRECSYGYIARDIPVDRAVDWEKARAKYRNGVLTVQLPKRENTRKAIEVRVN
jgi:HSP20 family protein